MTPRIKGRQLCTIRPYVRNEPLKRGDILLCKVHGSYYLHLVSALREGQVQISNNHGHVNGWCPLADVYGVLVDVQA